MNGYRHLRELRNALQREIALSRKVKEAEAA
jgi:hypothetical protein